MRWDRCRSKRGKFAGMCGHGESDMQVCCASPFPKEDQDEEDVDEEDQDVEAGQDSSLESAENQVC